MWLEVERPLCRAGTASLEETRGKLYKNLYNQSVKPLRFVGSSLDDLRNFPEEARKQAGFELFAVQQGLEPSDWKTMNSIGPGVREIRVRVLGEWRVIYLAKLDDAIYVLHAFQKKTQKTSKSDLELARKRYRSLI